jgi:hypothetical protein
MLFRNNPGTNQWMNQWTGKMLFRNKLDWTKWVTVVVPEQLRNESMRVKMLFRNKLDWTNWTWVTVVAPEQLRNESMRVKMLFRNKLDWTKWVTVVVREQLRNEAMDESMNGADVVPEQTRLNKMSHCCCSRTNEWMNQWTGKMLFRNKLDWTNWVTVVVPEQLRNESMRVQMLFRNKLDWTNWTWVTVVAPEQLKNESMRVKMMFRNKLHWTKWVTDVVPKQLRNESRNESMNGENVVPEQTRLNKMSNCCCSRTSQEWINERGKCCSGTN